MPRSKRPRFCACGCRQETEGGKWLSGHDSKTSSDVITELGGTENLLVFVERYLGREVPRVKRPEVER